jgi:TonB family protein
MNRLVGVLVLYGLPVLGQSLQVQAVAPPPGQGGGTITVLQGTMPPEPTPEQIATLEKRVANYPADLESRMQLVSMYMRKQEPDKAEPHAWWILENRPDHGGAGMAISILAGDRTKLAAHSQRIERVLNEHLEKRGDDPQLISNVAQYYQRTSFEKAEELLLRARKLTPVQPYPSDMITVRLASLYATAIRMEGMPANPMMPPDAASMGARVRQQLLSAEDPMLSGYTGSNLAMIVTSPRGGNDPRLPELKLLAERLLQIGLDANPGQQQFRASMDRLQGRMPEGGAPGRITVGGNVQAAMLEQKVPAEYPAQAAQARISGTVRFSVVIGKDGTVQGVQVVSGHPLLLESAMKAVRQYRYKPTLLNGQPVEVTTQVDVNFQPPQ